MCNISNNINKLVSEIQRLSYLVGDEQEIIKSEPSLSTIMKFQLTAKMRARSSLNNQKTNKTKISVFKISHSDFGGFEIIHHHPLKHVPGSSGTLEHRLGSLKLKRFACLCLRRIKGVCHHTRSAILQS